MATQGGSFGYEIAITKEEHGVYSNCALAILTRPAVCHCRGDMSESRRDSASSIEEDVLALIYHGDGDGANNGVDDLIRGVPLHPEIRL